jgi:hypothetical protein
VPSSNRDSAFALWSWVTLLVADSFSRNSSLKSVAGVAAPDMAAVTSFRGPSCKFLFAKFMKIIVRRSV